jgi:hypothetical protein
MPRGPRPIDWRCPSCQALLGVEREGELHLRYKTAIYVARGPVRAVCRRCHQVSERTPAPRLDPVRQASA